MEENMVLEKEAIRRWLQGLCVLVYAAHLRGGGISGGGRTDLKFLNEVSKWERLLFQEALYTQQGRPN